MRLYCWLIRKLTAPKCPFCREYLDEGHTCAMGQYFMRQFAEEIRRLQILDTSERREKEKVTV